MTPNKENFIKAIYELGGAFEIIPNKSLAKELDVSAASITDMNSRLVKANIITYTPYRGVKLTESGIEIAHQLIRRHRLWEVFLSEKLGYRWDELHEDADLLEHISSDKLIERLDAFLGHPTVDPHGDIIPNQEGETAPVNNRPLAEFKEGDVVTVKQVDDNEAFLQYLTDKGIALGHTYKIKQIDPFDGPYILEGKNGQDIIVSNKASFNIFVDVD